jgi:hypothetical protein
MSNNSQAIASTSTDAFCNFLSHSFVLRGVNLGFSTHKYLETLDTSVIGTNNLSLFLYSSVIYSFFIHDNSFSTISRKIPIP